MAETERLLPQTVEEGRKAGFVTESLHQVSRHGLHEDDDHVPACRQAVGFHAACDGRYAVHALPSEEGLHAGYGFAMRCRRRFSFRLSSMALVIRLNTGLIPNWFRKASLQ